MATKATAAAAFHVMALQTPEGKQLIKDNHVCICPEGLGGVCVPGKIFSSSLLTDENRMNLQKL